MTTYFSSETIQARRQRSNILEYNFESLLCVGYCLVLGISSEHNKDGQYHTHMKPGVLHASSSFHLPSVYSLVVCKCLNKHGPSSLLASGL